MQKPFLKWELPYCEQLEGQCALHGVGNSGLTENEYGEMGIELRDHHRRFGSCLLTMAIM